jgi:hypothetical protein
LASLALPPPRIIHTPPRLYICLVSLTPPPPSQIIHTSRLGIAGFTTAADGFYSAMANACGRLIANSSIAHVKVKEECMEFASRRPITCMNFPPATMCDLFGARLMAAYTIAIGAAGGFAIAVDYSYFTTAMDY